MRIKIGSFNCANFGRGSLSGNKSRQIASIIMDYKLDVVALQEIKGPKVLEDILLQLNNGKCGRKWDGCADGEVNDYGFIWNTGRIALPRTKGANGVIRTFFPHIYKQYRRDPELGMIDLKRPPFYGRFQTTFSGLPNIELRLINTHIRFSKAKDGEELAPSASDIALRQFEFRALTQNIYYRAATKVYGKAEGRGDPRTAYTVLLGDYNLNLSASGAGSPLLGLEEIIIPCRTDSDREQKLVTLQKELSTLKKPSDDGEENTSYFANNYDHFTLDENRFSDIDRQTNRINSVEKYYDSDAKEHYRELSDHTPIMLTLTIQKG